jgi:hypothetical protein
MMNNVEKKTPKLHFFMLRFIVLKKTQCENSSLKKLLTTYAIKLHTWDTKAFVTPYVELIWPSMINLFIMLMKLHVKSIVLSLSF